MVYTSVSLLRLQVSGRQRPCHLHPHQVKFNFKPCTVEFKYIFNRKTLYLGSGDESHWMVEVTGPWLYHCMCIYMCNYSTPLPAPAFFGSFLVFTIVLCRVARVGLGTYYLSVFIWLCQKTSWNIRKLYRLWNLTDLSWNSSFWPSCWPWASY